LVFACCVRIDGLCRWTRENSEDGYGFCRPNGKLIDRTRFTFPQRLENALRFPQLPQPLRWTIFQFFGFEIRDHA
jgi:hypothetical protein